MADYRHLAVLLLLSLLSIASLSSSSPNSVTSSTTTTKQLYVVYLGNKVHADPDITSARHLHILSNVHDGSLEAARRSIVYSYKHGFSGFSAMLTADQAAFLADSPHVLSVFPSKKRELHTTHSWDFLGFPIFEIGNTPLNSAKQSDVIIGFLDTGIWPESSSFNDAQMPPIPSRWAGKCEAGENFTTTMCNKKLIGARYYKQGVEASNGPKLAFKDGGNDFLSAKDSIGHGTHTASIAAGRFVPGAGYNNTNREGSELGKGTARGGAPFARIAVYKVCWTEGCYDADVLAGFDDAIKDNVDIISLSIGPVSAISYFTEANSIGSFHAVRKGISVISSVANNGPDAGSLINGAPWMFGVAASSTDRNFFSNVILGNRQSFKGISLSIKHMDVKSASLIYGGDANLPHASPRDSRYCSRDTIDPAKAAGKIVVCLSQDAANLDMSNVIKELGSKGLIIIDEKDENVAIPFCLPATVVGNKDGIQILAYINSTRFPTAYITPTISLLNSIPAPRVATFSSRGPNIISPDVLKPDISAPGLNILAAWSPVVQGLNFNIQSGTSMSAPHVTGIAALLKASNPTWSPAAIKSAIMTTASVFDNQNKLIKALPTGGDATPFDMGAGHVSPVKAQNPGLIYDAGPDDYVKFLCAIGYNATAVRAMTGDVTTVCPPMLISASNLNYPSISISKLVGKASVMRTLTNVGQPRSIYKATVDVVPEGVEVKVIPDTLSFTSVGQKLTFSVEFTVQVPAKGYVFGSLSWTDGKHKVRSPIALNTSL